MEDNQTIINENISNSDNLLDNQLIYLFVGDIGNSINNQGINFGNGYNVEFDYDNIILKIEKNTKKQISYGDNIKSLDLIVGKNGSGKTLLLNLLASPKDGRNDVFGYGYKNFSWFAIYHIKKDYFAIEGQGKDLINLMKKSKFIKHFNMDEPKKEFDIDLETNEIIEKSINIDDLYLNAFTKSINSVGFKYDFSYLEMKELKYLQDFEQNYKLHSLQYVYYAYYRVNTNITWFIEPRFSNNFYVNDYVYKRLPLTHPDFVKLFKYFKNEEKEIINLENEFSNYPKGFVTFRLVRPDELTVSVLQTSSDENEKSLKYIAREIYFREDIDLVTKERIMFNKQSGFDKDPLNSNALSNKEAFICMFLEDTVYKNMDIARDEINKIAPYFSNKVMNYDNRKNYLLDLIDESYKDRSKENVPYNVNQLTRILEKIPDEYFVACDCFEFNVREIVGDWIYGLAENVYENNRLLSKDESIGYIRYDFKYLSSGEAYFIDIYSSLFTALKQLGVNEHDDCILVLDEPDARFHPEWSRNFINNLTKRLSSSPFKNYNFQIIISTHSPYFVSDVECEHVNCFESKNGTISINKAKNGFMCQLGDIFMDDFFVKSVFGAFSEEYVNKIIKDLNKLMEKLDKNESIDNSFLKPIEEKIIPIKDRIISNALNSKVSYIKRRLGII